MTYELAAERLSKCGRIQVGIPSMGRISQQNAFIFRITHIENVPWILRNGLHCRNSPVRDTGFREIGNPELIDKRQHRQVPVGPGGTLSDYVPFYFTHYSPMLLNIKTGHNGIRQVPMSEIVILVSNLHRMSAAGVPFVFTDRHAYTALAQYFTQIEDLHVVDWKILAARDFRKNPDDPSKMERYMAEALIYRNVPISTLLGMVCYSPRAETQLAEMQANAGTSLKTVVKPDWFFR